jgi:hypothetical protein
MTAPIATASQTLRQALEDTLALVGQATPGDWRVRQGRSEQEFFIQAPRLDPNDPYDIEVLGEDDTLYPTRRADADAIVALMAFMRTHGPELLRAVELDAKGHATA